MAASRIRLTTPTLAVLGVLMAAGPDDRIWGFRLCEEADLGSGTVYPLLERLENAGWIVGIWEDPPPTDRPRRRFYEMTTAGRRDATSAIAARATARRRWLPGAAHGGAT
jgi:DNA-binding MarR family transcriptional regulator